MNSIIMHAAVISSYFTGPTILPEETVEEKVQETKKALGEEEKLVDDNSMECFLEFLIEFFN